MTSKLELNRPGTHIRATCECGHVREELVNPAINPNPFFFQPNCTACNASLDPDLELIRGMQDSYLRAISLAKKTAQSTNAMGGQFGGDPGSPAYPAHNTLLARDFIKEPPDLIPLAERSAAFLKS